MSRIARLVTTTYLLVLCAASVGRAGHIESASMGGSTSNGFSVFSTPTKWNPGTNSASIFRANKKGPRTAGGASWSIMGAGHTDASGADSSHGANTSELITGLNVSGFGASDYEGMVDAVLNVWADASGFTNLGQVADRGVSAGASESIGGHLGDIRLAAWEIAEANVLAHAYQPGSEAIFGTGGTIAGDVHVDVNRTWSDDPTDTNADADVDLMTVLLHELGHSLGLGHSTTSGSVMEAVYGGARRELTADDLAGIHYIYGSNEANDGGGGGGKPPWAGGPGGRSIVPEPSSTLLATLGWICLLATRGQRRSRL